jgi:hypothetical protein
MRIWHTILATLVLVACSGDARRQADPLPKQVYVPASMRSCGEKPLPPAPPRSVKAIAEYTHELAAWGDGCANTVTRLFRWADRRYIYEVQPGGVTLVGDGDGGDTGS